LAARAQQPFKAPIIGFLGASTSAAWSPWTSAFMRRLGELGWSDGRNLRIEYRWAEGREERYAEIATEFVRLKVDVIVTVQSALVAAKQATSTIPIVFAIAPDPVGAGLVGSLAKPGGNVTGLSMQATDIAAKRIELIREVLPDLRRLALMANVGYPASVLGSAEGRTGASQVGLELDLLEIRHAKDVVPAFAALKRGMNALVHGLQAAEVLAPRKPIIGALNGCCACAASGHAAAPPRSVMNSRRLRRLGELGW